ncbi:hypothetical protein RND71_014556 [Anisodus tanguticus]|uniref:Uncharacterized protein n=1 Tax=Anisodus tanguticus TaxID=243964 RepID=A0AAE1SBH2_9SOLA|nr:hypothetical protein RND71_014556 [Anisodus tanguticus]
MADYGGGDPPPVVALETTNEETSKPEFSEDEEILIAKMYNLVGERGDNLPDILLQPKDHAHSIGLKGESEHSTEEIKGLKSKLNTNIMASELNAEISKHKDNNSDNGAHNVNNNNSVPLGAPPVDP